MTRYLQCCDGQCLANFIAPYFSTTNVCTFLCSGGEKKYKKILTRLRKKLTRGWVQNFSFLLLEPNVNSGSSILRKCPLWILTSMAHWHMDVKFDIYDTLAWSTLYFARITTNACIKQSAKGTFAECRLLVPSGQCCQISRNFDIWGKLY
jgi:hypothetical protein